MKSEDGIWIGGDRAESNPDYVSISSEPKIFRKPGFLIGVDANSRVAQILEYIWSPPKHHEGSLMEYLCGEFVRSIVSCIGSEKFLEDSSGVVAMPDAAGCVIAHLGELFVLQSDFSFRQPKTDYIGRGSAYLVAEGSLHTTNRYNIPGRERVKLALEAAAARTPFVRGPFDIEKA